MTNPYLLPADLESEATKSDLESELKSAEGRNLLVAWPVVLGVNLIVPLLLGAGFLGAGGWGAGGWAGVVVAIVLFLIAGMGKKKRETRA